MDNDLVRTDTYAQLKRLGATLGVAAALIGGPILSDQAEQAEVRIAVPAAGQASAAFAGAAAARNRITMAWETEMAHAEAQGGTRMASAGVSPRVSVSLSPVQSIRGDLIAQLR